MPELPEVEIMARNLRRWAVGRRIVQARVECRRLASPPLTAWVRTLPARVTAVRRRAKVVLLHTDTHILAFHFRMTGKVVAAAPEDRAHVRLVLSLDGDGPPAVVFDDPRRLGTVDAYGGKTVADGVLVKSGLGPEPWPEARDAGFYEERLGASRSAIKVALLDQKRVAGLGNIAASESLWRARIDPRLRPAQLSSSQWSALAAAVPAFIDDTIARESGDEIAYVNSRPGSGTGVESPFDVYRRDGSPCPRCGATIERFVQSGRSTFWCPPCQTTP